MKLILIKADSGALRNYFKNYYKLVLVYIKPETDQVVNPSNNEVTTSSF